MRNLLSLILAAVLLYGRYVPAAAQDGDYTYIFVNLTDQTVDLYMNGETAFLGTAPLQVTPERVRGVSPDSAELYRANNIRSADSALAAANIAPEAGATIILAAFDTGDGVEMRAVQRNLDPLPANLARLQVVHLGETLPALTVNAQNADQLIADLAFEETFTAEIPGGNYQLALSDPEGETVGAASVQAVPAASVTLLVYGAEDSARTLQITNRVEQMALLRVVHAGRITPPLDIYLDGELLIENVVFGAATDYLTLPPGNYTADLYEAGAVPGTDNPLATGTLQLGTGYPITAVALGEANLRLIPYIDNIQQIPENRARVKVIHAATNMPLLDVFERTTRLVGGLEFALSSPNFNIETGAHTLRFDETNAETYALLENYALESHTVYTFVLVGNALVNGSVQIIPVEWHWKAQ